MCIYRRVVMELEGTGGDKCTIQMAYFRDCVRSSQDRATTVTQ